MGAAALLPAAGSLLAGAGGAAAGVGTALSIAGTAISGFQKFQQAKAAGRAERLASEARARELNLRSARQETQAAVEAADRQRRLRSVLAEQRARFAGAGVEIGSGSPVRIAEQTQSEIARQDRQAGLFNSLTVSSLNRQASSEIRAGQAAQSSANFAATGSLINTASTVAGQISDAKDLGVF